MAIKIKAIERKLKYEKGENAPYEYRYVLQADLYRLLRVTRLRAVETTLRVATRARLLLQTTRVAAPRPEVMTKVVYASTNL